MEKALPNVKFMFMCKRQASHGAREDKADSDAAPRSWSLVLVALAGRRRNLNGITTRPGPWPVDESESESEAESEAEAESESELRSESELMLPPSVVASRWLKCPRSTAA